MQQFCFILYNTKLRYGMGDKRSVGMRSDSVKNMSAYADQNHAPSLAAARLECE